jgi:aldehyde dehydrogenase (NAD+)
MDFNQFNNILYGGSWQEGTSQTLYQVTNPYNREVLTEIRLNSVQDIDQAYQTALKAQKGWAETPASRKAEIMERAAQLLQEKREELVRILIRETGSTHLKANVEIDLATNILKESATFPYRMTGMIFPGTIPGKENRVYRKPVGVVTVISPWNVPLHLSMRSVAPALAAGNSVVLKPDLQTAISGGLVLAKIFEEAGLPSGVLNVIVADIPEIGDAVIEHPIPRMISFTGSTAVGKHIAEVAGRNLKKASLELGGNSAFIVLDDADLEQAVSAAMFGKFFHHGQICMAINRMIIDRKRYHEFAELFREKAETLKVGDPSDPQVHIGPLINEKQAARIRSFMDDSLAEGAHLLLKGSIDGNLMTPHILTDVSNNMTIARNEVFGPVAVMIPVDGEEEAIRVANDTVHGLSGAVFTSNVERGVRVAKQLQTGMAHVNDQTINDEPFVSFGGEKESGIGRHNGQWALEEFTTVQWISVQEAARTYPFS